MQPKSITRTSDGIQIEWQDGHISSFSAKFLRRKCPCAVCKETPKRVDGMIPLSALSVTPVEIKAANQMGWYALQFVFSDNHDTGIYSYEILRKNCPCEKCKTPLH
jgi:DUF971 family protein